MDRLKELAKEQVEKAKEFNRHPPKWAYWVFGLVVVVIIQIVVASLRH